MTVNVSEQRIELTAIDKASAAFKSVTGSVGNLRSSLDTVSNALTAVGVTVGIGAMLSLAKDVLKATAALDDMAESTGASVEILSAIQRVAKVGGHDFEGLTQQIGRTVKNLREGSDEGGRAAQALDFLGIKARDSNGKFRDMGQVLVDVAKGLDKYEDGGNKVALVQDILGKGAERYIPLLKDMAEGTDLVATTTRKQAEEAERAEKAMNRLGVVFEDNRRQLVNEYTPALRTLLEEMSEGIRISGGFGAAIRNLGLIDPWPGLRENIKRTQDELAQWQAAGPVGRFFAKPFGATYAGTEGDLQKRIQFMKYQERQQALAGAGDPSENLDARDRLARGSREELTYNPAEDGKGASKRREELQQARLAAARNEETILDRQNASRSKELDRLEKLELKSQEEDLLAQEKRMQERDEMTRTTALQANELQKRYDDNLRMLVAAREQQLLTEAEFNERMVELNIQHQERVTGVTNTAYQQRQRFVQSSMLVQAQTIFGELANITSGVAQHNKALFQINKVAGIANAIINAEIGISKTLATYSYPWNIALAALHAAAAYAQVRAISSASFGGGAVSAPSIAGSTPATPVTPVSGASAPRGPDTIINIQSDRGGMFSEKAIRELIERINEGTRDGGRIVLR